MPRGDGTGPAGLGSMTGRGAGFCAGFLAPGRENTICRGMGLGYGRGFRRMNNIVTGFKRTPGMSNGAYASKVSEKEFISKQVNFLENQLFQLKKQLEGMDEET